MWMWFPETKTADLEVRNVMVFSIKMLQRENRLLSSLAIFLRCLPNRSQRCVQSQDVPMTRNVAEQVTGMAAEMIFDFKIATGPFKGR